MVVSLAPIYPIEELVIVEIYDSPTSVATLVVTLISPGFLPPWVKMALTSIVIDIITCIFVLYLNHLCFHHKKTSFVFCSKSDQVYIYTTKSEVDI